jgi:hypothetical protein
VHAAGLAGGSGPDVGPADAVPASAAVGSADDEPAKRAVGNGLWLGLACTVSNSSCLAQKQQLRCTHTKTYVSIETEGQFVAFKGKRIPHSSSDCRDRSVEKVYNISFFVRPASGGTRSSTMPPFSTGRVDLLMARAVGSMLFAGFDSTLCHRAPTTQYQGEDLSRSRVWQRCFIDDGTLATELPAILPLIDSAALHFTVTQGVEVEVDQVWVNERVVESTGDAEDQAVLARGGFGPHVDDFGASDKTIGVLVVNVMVVKADQQQQQASGPGSPNSSRAEIVDSLLTVFPTAASDSEDLPMDTPSAMRTPQLVSPGLVVEQAVVSLQTYTPNLQEALHLAESQNATQEAAPKWHVDLLHNGLSALRLAAIDPLQGGQGEAAQVPALRAHARTRAR